MPAIGIRAIKRPIEIRRKSKDMDEKLEGITVNAMKLLKEKSKQIIKNDRQRACVNLHNVTPLPNSKSIPKILRYKTPDKKIHAFTAGYNKKSVSRQQNERSAKRISYSINNTSGNNFGKGRVIIRYEMMEKLLAPKIETEENKVEKEDTRKQFEQVEKGRCGSDELKLSIANIASDSFMNQPIGSSNIPKVSYKEKRNILNKETPYQLAVVFQLLF